MEIKFLGTGGAFEYTKGTSSAVVTQGNRQILIDCGSSVFGQLQKHDLMENIDYILLTHMHGDHVACLFQYIYFNYFKLHTQTKFIYTSEEFKCSIIAFLDAQNVNREYYDFTRIDAIEGVDYVDTTGMHVTNMIGHAYYFTKNDELIYYSGDIGSVDTASEFLAERTERIKTVFHDISWASGESHTYYIDAMEKLSDYNTYGYHCTKETMPNNNTLPLVENYPELNYGFSTYTTTH